MFLYPQSLPIESRGVCVGQDDMLGFQNIIRFDVGFYIHRYMGCIGKTAFP